MQHLRRHVWVTITFACLVVAMVVAGTWNIARRNSIREHSAPSRLAALPRPTSGWLQVSTGVDHTCGVRADGTAWCWGSNQHGQLGDGTRRGSRVPVEVAPVPAYDRHTEMGSNSAAWVQISAGSMNTCAIRTDHTAWCWGANRYGQVGTLSADYKTPAPDAAHPQQVAQPFHGPVLLVAINTGDKTSCGLDEEGVGWCWGSASVGQGTDQGFSPARIEQTQYYFDQIASDGAHTCAVAFTHRLWCWGSSAFGEIGNGRAAPSHRGPAPTGAVHNWALVSPGTHFTCGLRSDGTAWCWGLNERGQLGTDDTALRLLPSQVGTASDWAALESGHTHVCGIRAPGSMWCWGENAHGQLGTGNTAYRKVPTRVGTGSSWVEVSSGERHSCAVAANGTAWCWGSNGYGQLGDGTTTRRWKPAQVRFAGQGSQ